MKEMLLKYVFKFQKGLISRREFLKEVNHIILKIPEYIGYYDNDIKYEFYAQFIAKIDKVISFYKKQNDATFITWFNIVLKRDFYNFILRKNKKEYLENDLIYDYSLNEINEDLNNSIPNENTAPTINLSRLTEKEKTIVAYKYGIHIEGRDINDTIEQILNKLDKKKKIEKMIAKRYFKLLNLHKTISGTLDEELIFTLKQNAIKLKNSKRRLEKTYHGYSIFPSNRWIGEKLGLSGGTVDAYLNKIKKKLYKSILA